MPAESSSVTGEGQVREGNANAAFLAVTYSCTESKMKSGKPLVLAAIILWGNALLLAQLDPSLETGIKPYGSYHGGDLDSVNLSNGNLILHIPLAAVPQRGDLSYGPRLTYNNKGWAVIPNCNSGTGNCQPYWVWNGQGITLDQSSEDQFGVSWGPPYKGSLVNVFTAGTADGSVHQLLSNQAGGMQALDGTGIWYDGSTPPTHQMGIGRDRRGIRATANDLRDTNGNFFSESPATSLTDTLGRNLSLIWSPSTDISGCTGPLPITGAGIVTLPGFNGGTKSIKFCDVSVKLQTNYQASGYYNDTLTPIADRGYTVSNVQGVVLYNGTSWTTSPAWTFEYDSYGDLTKITLPTGGSISYTWGTISSCDPHATTPFSDAVVSRTVDANDGTGLHTWTYGNGLVTDPDGNDTVHTFTGLNNSCSFYETKTQYFQGSYKSGQLLKTVDTYYRWIANPLDNVIPGNTLPTVTNVFPIRITTTWPSGKVTKVEKDYDSNLNIGAPGQAPLAISYGNLIETREYDYGDGAPGPLLRRTDYVYKAFDGTPTASSYLAFNLLDRVSSVTTYNGNGNQVAQTTYGYDESSLQPSGINTQHDTTLDNPGIRGNRTSVSRWINTTGGALKTTATYYDTGTPYQVTDPAGNVTTNFYGAGFQTKTSFAGAYVTQVQNALQQNTFFDYDFGTGLRIATQDANQQVSTSDYDFLNRILHSNAPDKGKITWTYNDTQPPTVTVTNTITDTVNRSQEADLDGVGRLVTTKLTSDPEGTDFVDTAYDALGRVLTVSNPHRSATGSTDGVTTSHHDALGRVTQVIAQDGGISTTDYSQFPTITVTDQAGNQRRSRTDALGRLAQVDEPAAIGPPTAATGSISISGGEQNVATAWVAINGFEAKMQPSDCPLHQTCPYEYDNGECGIAPGASVGYAGSDNTASIASNLASQINSGNLLTATVSGSAVYLTTKPSGSPSNLSLSAWCSSYNPDFSSSGFSTTQSGANFNTVYDSGTVSLTIPGCSSNPSVPYSQSVNTTSSAVAASLASSVNSITSCPVTASPSGSTLTFTAKQLGSSGNVSVTGSSSTSQSGYFGQPSFSASSGTVSGGLDHTGGFLTPATTLYSYDALGNLTQVQQQGFSSTCDANCRVRSFQYNSLSQLTSATNPESGTITYTYDANGNLLQKNSPAPNQTGSTTQTISYCYDALSRVTGKAYSAQTCTNGLLPSGTAAVSYTYDQGTNGVGRLTSLTDQAGSGTYTYDVMGRIASEQRTIAGVSKSMGYTYNRDGSVNTVTYPSSAVLAYTPSAAGRMLSVADNGNGVNYVISATYAPPGDLTGFVSGNSGSFAGITNSFSYNQRLQPINMSAFSPSQTVFSLGYDFHLGNGDNGNVWAITNNRDQARSQTFAYDQLNRLTSAQNAGTDCTQSTANGKTKFWGNSYGYDAWGNLLSKSVTKCSAENLSVTATANNQLSGYSYDAAGNMTYDATANLNYSYDQENRITGAAGYTYTYDDDGNRVEKSNGSTGTLYWYMTPGIVAESDLAGNLQSEYVFFDGARVARKDFPSNAVSYYFSDHLKTASVITDSQGNIKSESDYYPWGGELSFSNSDSNHYKFTGKERDNETGLDYLGARYYSNALGRFITPDWSAVPVAVPYADLDDPQSLNQYSYVRNIPTSKADTNGHECPTCPPPTLPDPTAADWELIDEAGAGATGLSFSAILTGAAIVFVPAMLFPDALPGGKVGQSNADERAQIEQASQERARQNGGVDPQKQGQTDQQQKAEPEPQAASGGAGQRTGGGRNAPKVNQDRRQSAANKLTDLRKQRDALQSKRNKTPEDKAELDRLNKAINREIDRMRESEEHSRKDKGPK